MKKVLFSLFALAIFFGLLQAGVEENIVQMLQKQTGKKVSVTEIVSLSSQSNLKIVVIEDLETKYKIPMLATKDGGLVVGLSNVFFSDNEKDAALINKTYEQAQAFNLQQQNSVKLNALFDSIPDDYVISIPSTAKNNQKITYIVSDPSCPHCQDELKQIDSRLKESNVKIIIVGFLGKGSITKAALIQEKIKSVKTPAEKISTLQKIYAPSYQAEGSKDREVKKVENITQKILESNLIKFVPYIYEYKK